MFTSRKQKLLELELATTRLNEVTRLQRENAELKGSIIPTLNTLMSRMDALIEVLAKTHERRISEEPRMVRFSDPLALPPPPVKKGS